jgi:multimeric flavodoxin WrbA
VGSNPLKACFFNLILARLEMYVGMGMSFVGGGENENGNELYKGGDNEKGNGEGGIEKAEQGMRMAEHGMTAYPLLP